MDFLNKISRIEPSDIKDVFDLGVFSIGRRANSKRIATYKPRKPLFGTNKLSVWTGLKSGITHLIGTSMDKSVKYLSEILELDYEDVKSQIDLLIKQVEIDYSQNAKAEVIIPNLAKVIFDNREIRLEKF